MPRNKHDPEFHGNFVRWYIFGGGVKSVGGGGNSNPPPPCANWVSENKYGENKLKGWSNWGFLSIVFEEQIQEQQIFWSS